MKGRAGAHLLFQIRTPTTNFMTPCAVSSQISHSGRSTPSFLTLSSVA